jgi:predicted porin
MNRLGVVTFSGLGTRVKRTLAALALGGAIVGAAQAQSSVTLYGIIDMGLQWNERGVNTGTTAAPNWNQEAVWSIDSGYQSGSRFGLRGSEALGMEWRAVFTLEGGYDASTGQSSQGGRLFGRQAWVGLAHPKFGTVALGRIATASSGAGSFDLWGAVGPFGITWGLNSLGSTFIPSSGLREDNSIIWASPSWAGFKMAAQWSANVDGGESAPQGSNTSAYNVSANYTWGALFVAATYDVIDYADAGSAGRPAAGNPNQKMLQIGGSWDFKVVKINVAWADQSNISTVQTLAGIGGAVPQQFVPVGIGNYNNNAWMIGGSAPLFGGRLLASYQYSDAKNIVNGSAEFEPDYYVWGFGYEYPFSRRTNAYVGYAQRSWDGRITSTSGLVLPYMSQAFEREQFAVGIRHLF